MRNMLRGVRSRPKRHTSCVLHKKMGLGTGACMTEGARSGQQRASSAGRLSRIQANRTNTMEKSPAHTCRRVSDCGTVIRTEHGTVTRQRSGCNQAGALRRSVVEVAEGSVERAGVGFLARYALV